MKRVLQRSLVSQTVVGIAPSLTVVLPNSGEFGYEESFVWTG